jgi:hypothetical protein
MHFYFIYIYFRGKEHNFISKLAVFHIHKFKETRKKMQLAKNKLAAISIAIVLIISIGASVAFIPTTSAHGPGLTAAQGGNVPWNIPTYAYIVVQPNPIGVGQPITVYMWLDAVYGEQAGTVNGVSGQALALQNNYRFLNYNLTIVAPDNTVATTIFPIIDDTTSNIGYSYTPSQLGTYQFIFNYPGQTYGANGNGLAGSVMINDTYAPSIATENLTVQSQPITSVGALGNPMPTEYWTRPIYGENTNWYSISSNWLGIGSPALPSVSSGTITGFGQGALINRYPGDAIGSLTSHVMWTAPLTEGGVVGGTGLTPSGVGWFEGSAYENRYSNPIILNGVLYYTSVVSYTGVTAGPTNAVDLRTGQVLWSRTDVPVLSFGYIYNVYDANQHGVYPGILFTSNFARAFDAQTGDPLFNVTGVPTASATSLGSNGEQLKYIITNANTTANPYFVLSEWNSSRIWAFTYPPGLGPTLYNMTTVNGQPGNLSQYTTISIPPAGSNQYANGGINYNSIAWAVVNGNVPINATTINNLANGTGPQPSYDWNISIPWANSMAFQTLGFTLSATSPNPVTVLAAFPGNMMLCRNSTYPSGFSGINTGTSQHSYTYFAVDINPAHTSTFGTITWMKTYDPVPGNITVSYGGVDPTAPDGKGGKGVFVEGYAETMQWVGYSLADGSKLWTTPVGSQSAFDYYGAPYYPFDTSQLAYGNLYTAAFGGVLYCYNLTTGAMTFSYGNGNIPGNDTSTSLTPYGDYPMFLNAVGNGVIYTLTSEHTIGDPIYKGALARAINATTGQEIWTLSNYDGEFSSFSYAMADGYNTFFNGYDNQIYSVGRGPSALTVSAPNLGAASSQPVVISGTVTDVSAGTKQVQQASDFPNGVPVASDAIMGDWMGYVYQQQPLPTNFKGVDVTIYVVDANNNSRPIGTATTDATGQYNLVWTPDVAGTYKVTAAFSGNAAYWPSSATTAFTVMEAHATSTPAPTPVPPSAADLYFVPAIAGLFVFVAIIGVVIILVLRKHA